MFLSEGNDEPKAYLVQMILANNEKERRAALDKLFPYMKKDFKNTMKAMAGFPVTFRLLDPPLHEVLPSRDDTREKLARMINISTEEIKKRAETLHEVNPMLGHRGVRLGITYPELSEMQFRAILEAAAELNKEKIKAIPEIMVPVTCDASELKNHRVIFDRVLAEVLKKFGLKNLECLYGTMIEIPRACLLSNEMAVDAEFFSFGTNDLTQMTFGFSRDDVGSFMADYLEQKLLPGDPFQSIDECGVGQLVQYSCERGRSTRPKLKVGVCGEHGGDPASIGFFYKVGLNYVSCSPFRVPIARMAVAQAEIEARKAKAPAKKAPVKKAADKKAPAKKVAAKKPAAKKPN